MKVVIAGGGIGGFSAAIALCKAGFEVEVVERAAALQEVGAGLQLSPNATKGLAALGVRQGVMADLALMRRMSVRQVGHVPGAVVLESAPGSTFIELAELHGAQDVAVIDEEGRYWRTFIFVEGDFSRPSLLNSFS